MIKIFKTQCFIRSFQSQKNYFSQLIKSRGAIRQNLIFKNRANNSQYIKLDPQQKLTLDIKSFRFTESKDEQIDEIMNFMQQQFPQEEGSKEKLLLLEKIFKLGLNQLIIDNIDFFQFAPNNLKQADNLLTIYILFKILQSTNTINLFQIDKKNIDDSLSLWVNQPQKQTKIVQDIDNNNIMTLFTQIKDLLIHMKQKEQDYELIEIVKIYHNFDMMLYIEFNDKLNQQDLSSLLQAYSCNKDWSLKSLNQQIQLQNFLLVKCQNNDISQDTVLQTLQLFINTKVVNLNLLYAIEPLIVSQKRDDLFQLLLQVYCLLPKHISPSDNIKYLLNDHIRRQWKQQDSLQKISMLQQIFKIEILTNRPSFEQVKNYKLIDSQILSDINQFIAALRVDEFIKNENILPLIFLITFYQEKFRTQKLAKLVSQFPKFSDMRCLDSKFHSEVKQAFNKKQVIVEENFLTQSMFVVGFLLHDETLIDIIHRDSYVILCGVNDSSQSSLLELDKQFHIYEDRTSTQREKLIKLNCQKYVKVPQIDWERWKSKNDHERALDYLVQGYKIKDVRALF